MNFYEDIAKYYDLIFPASEATLKFIAGIAGQPPRSVLDVACGPGTYSKMLARLGYKVWAADIEPDFISGLRKSAEAEGLDIECILAGMLDMPYKTSALHGFDMIFCIGNSVVHLNDTAEIGDFVGRCARSLADGGWLVIQIINYDRVLTRNVTALPTIVNEKAGLKFERIYRYDEATSKIFFKTILTVGADSRENEIPLLPLLSTDLKAMFKAAGFTDITLFGDFGGSVYDPAESYQLIAKARIGKADHI